MQTLDLSGESRKSDGWFKSLFWPTVDNAWDVDYLGQQGFWICFALAVLNLGFTAFTVFESPNLVFRIGALIGGGAVVIVYFLGGMGVREHSFAAALFVFATYVLNQLVSGQLGIIPIIVAAVLLSNVRATFLVSRCKPASEDEDRPMRFNETFRDKLVDQLPPKVWPVLKLPFFIAASAILLLLLVLGGMGIARLAAGHAHAAPAEGSGQTVEVAPPGSK